MEADNTFDVLKDSILNLDPCFWAEKNLNLDNGPYRVFESGYRPIAEIMRYIATKATNKDGKPVVWLKSRQVSGTVTSAVIEMYFMACGLYGNGDNAPMRVAHIFPYLDHAAAFSKTKLSALIDNSNLIDDPTGKKGKKPLLRTLIDTSSASNDNLQFKQFKGGNHIWIESAGLDGNRLRGKTADSVFIDECLVYDTYIETINGKQSIGHLYEMFTNKQDLPLVKTFNESKQIFEFKKIINAWCRDEQNLLEIKCNNKIIIKCTPNHRFLTIDGWARADQLTKNTFLKASRRNNKTTTLSIDTISKLEIKEKVYDIEVEDNHNFIVTSGSTSRKLCGPILHNCQDVPSAAIANSVKILTKAQYGPVGQGVQVYFGTPKQRGSDFWKMWEQSSQQFFYLGCEKCEKHFPLYTPGSNEWESIWLYENVVKCTHCGCEQDRLKAINAGKWVATKNPDDAVFVGFHLNRLYLPEFTKEKILGEKPGISAINTERAYQNEVLGEFFQGETAIITPEQIREMCGDPERKFRASILPGEEILTFMGVDIGKKNDYEQLANSDKIKAEGQSYSTAVVISVSGAGRLSIEYATKFKRNDLASKKALLDEAIKRYNVQLTICDIGYAHDFNEIMQTEYGDKFLASSATGYIRDKVKYSDDVFPKVILFERDHWIIDLYEQMKNGMVRFPLGSYEQIAWLIQHCTSMEIKTSISRTGDVKPHYVKSGPNDGFMSLLNAYIAYKFYLTKGFTTRGGSNQGAPGQKQKASVAAYHLPR